MRARRILALEAKSSVHRAQSVKGLNFFHSVAFLSPLGPLSGVSWSGI